jgi:hypothetical protein
VGPVHVPLSRFLGQQSAQSGLDGGAKAVQEQRRPCGCVGFFKDDFVRDTVAQQCVGGDIHASAMSAARVFVRYLSAEAPSGDSADSQLFSAAMTRSAGSRAKAAPPAPWPMSTASVGERRRASLSSAR